MLRPVSECELHHRTRSFRSTIDLTLDLDDDLGCCFTPGGDWDSSVTRSAYAPVAAWRLMISSGE